MSTYLSLRPVAPHRSSSGSVWLVADRKLASKMDTSTDCNRARSRFCICNNFIFSTTSFLPDTVSAYFQPEPRPRHRAQRSIQLMGSENVTSSLPAGCKTSFSASQSVTRDPFVTAAGHPQKPVKSILMTSKQAVSLD